MLPTLPLDKMSVEEKLQTIELLWDSLAGNEDSVPSPDWHREVLEERTRQIESGEAGFISLEELKAMRPK
ncbi:addiction module protein [Thiohalocapsa marina]|uniref:addiction module protein n=1 Tax=Thiohalocapsa marina TaxID=424902 RepID=UPI0036D75C6A